MGAMLAGVGTAGIEQTRQELPVRGILGRSGRRAFGLHREPPSPDLAWCVEHHWIVEWDLPEGVEHRVELLAHPSLNLAIEDGGLFVYGVYTQVFTRLLRGQGRVYGIKFHPGGFRPFLPMDAAGLADRMIPAESVWPEASRLNRELHAAPDHADLIAAGENFLRDKGIRPDPLTAEANRRAQWLLTDPLVRQVSDVHGGWNSRAVQRLFYGYVGVTPRWVLRRGRLFEAAARIARSVHSGDGTHWAVLAADLGYADQAHFIRDFRDAVGQTPARYAAASGAR